MSEPRVVVSAIYLVGVVLTLCYMFVPYIPYRDRNGLIILRDWGYVAIALTWPIVFGALAIVSAINRSHR